MSGVDLEETDFASGTSGASETYPAQCSTLRKNGHVVIKSRPCKIVEMSTSKTGKHGHAKVHMVALDIFTGRKYEDICPSTHNMDVPHVHRYDYQLVDISDDDFLSLMDDSSEMHDHIKVPEGTLGDEIRKKFENEDQFQCSIIKSMGEERVVGIKAITK